MTKPGQSKFLGPSLLRPFFSLRQVLLKPVPRVANVSLVMVGLAWVVSVRDPLVALGWVNVVGFARVGLVGMSLSWLGLVRVGLSRIRT